MSGKEFKPQLFYLIRRGWNTQQLKLCDMTISKKGKDPMTVLWKSHALAMLGKIDDAVSELRAFESRADMQYLRSLARINYYQKESRPDYDLIRTLKDELSSHEDTMVPHFI